MNSTPDSKDSKKIESSPPPLEKPINLATAAVQTTQTSTPPPSFDAIAASLSALSAAFALGSIILAVLALVIGIGWGLFIKRLAENVAQEAAKSEAKKAIDQYLEAEGKAHIFAAVAAQASTPTTSKPTAQATRTRVNSATSSRKSK